MAITAPAQGDTVKVVDQSSEYRGKVGTVISADEPNQYITVKFTDSRKSVRLRMTQVKPHNTVSGGAITYISGNNPGGSKIASDPAYTPKNNERRDVLGAGYNPHDPTGTLNDSRPKLA